MLPKQNMAEFSTANTDLGAGEYIQYIETRLNNRLLLLSNPDLIKQLGLDTESVVAETKRLVSISNCVEIPTFVDEEEHQRRMEFRAAHPDLWEGFVDFQMQKNGALPSDVDEAFIRYIEFFIKNQYYMLPGETAADADLRRLAFRKENSALWKEYSDYYTGEYGALPDQPDKYFEQYVKKMVEHQRLQAEAEQRDRAQRDANSDAYAKSRGYENAFDMMHDYGNR